jgi:hypothetical protein
MVKFAIPVATSGAAILRIEHNYRKAVYLFLRELGADYVMGNKKLRAVWFSCKEASLYAALRTNPCELLTSVLVDAEMQGGGYFIFAVSTDARSESRFRHLSFPINMKALSPPLTGCDASNR